MVSFELAGGTEAAKRVAKATRVFILGESLGGVESLLAWPPMMSHATMTEEVRVARGIPGSLLRLSVGIEDIDDLLADLDQALSMA
jgi:cystathionine beta-lyase/cystathionine gamma-synthase